MNTDTMRRVRAYKRATASRTNDRIFQSRMLVHLIRIDIRRKNIRENSNV